MLNRFSSLILIFLINMSISVAHSTGITTGQIVDPVLQKEALRRVVKLMPRNMDSALILLELVSSAADCEDPLLKAEYFNAKGVCYWFSNDPEKAISWFKKTLALNPSDKILPEIVRAANNAGSLYNLMVVTDSARKYLEMALALDQKRGYEPGIYKTSYDLGVFYFNCDQYNLSLRYLQKVYDHFKSYPDTLILNNTYNALGNVYFRIDSISLATIFYKKGLDDATRLKDQRNQILFCKNLTAVYCVVPGGLKNTIRYGKMALALAGETDLQTIFTVNANIGNAYINMLQSDSALVYLKKAEQLVRDVFMADQVSMLFCNLGKVYSFLGNTSQARQYLIKSLGLATEIQYLSCQYNVLKALAALDSNAHDYRSSLGFQRKAMILRDSILSTEARTRLAEFHVLYETQQKENEISRLEQKSKYNHWLMIVGLLIAIMTVALLFSLAMYFRKRHKVSEQQRALEQAEAKRIQVVMEAGKQELTGKIQSLVRAEQVIEEMKTEMEELIRQSQTNGTEMVAPELTRIKTEDRQSILWEEFEQRFNELNNGFINRLVRIYPDLSPAEVRICAMLHLQLSGKQIAELIYRSPRTIDHTRNSIRKKMGLSPDDNLVNHLLSL